MGALFSDPCLSTDCSTSTNECEQANGSCNLGVCTFQKQPVGTSCSGGLCTADGNCVGMISPSISFSQNYFKVVQLIKM